MLGAVVQRRQRRADVHSTRRLQGLGLRLARGQLGDALAVDLDGGAYGHGSSSARADRASFGCADENDFTYFGRAFFKEALPQSSSFEEAFEKATVLIAQWETTQQIGRASCRERV